MHWYNRFHHSRKIIHFAFWGSIIFILLIILLYNVILSQTISPLYSRLVQDEKSAMGTILKSIQTLPDFKRLYVIYKNKYGTKIENDVFEEKKKDTLFVNNLENILRKYPESRDIIYNLSQILKKTGGDGVGYLNYAKQIDPEID